MYLSTYNIEYTYLYMYTTNIWAVPRGLFLAFSALNNSNIIWKHFLSFGLIFQKLNDMKRPVQSIILVRYVCASQRDRWFHGLQLRRQDIKHIKLDRKHDATFWRVYCQNNKWKVMFSPDMPFSRSNVISNLYLSHTSASTSAEANSYGHRPSAKLHTRKSI